MFKEDLKRIKACIEYEDFYSALEYAILIKNSYDDKEKEYFENIIKCIKLGKYKKIFYIFDKFQHDNFT